jgi:hypothetical protein
MLNAKLLGEVWEDSFLGKRPYDVLTLVGYDLPALDDHEEWSSEEPELNELELTTNAIAMYVADKAEGHPLSIFTTGLALGYLTANREALEGVSA